MSEPFIAQIQIVGFNFAPRGWALCNGQLLPISQNTALFSLLGTTYGGDGKSNFALPNMQGSTPLAPGQGPGLSLIDLGQIGGSQSVTLLTSEIPAHSHGTQCNGAVGDQYAPPDFFWAQDAGGNNEYGASANSAMNGGAVGPSGGNLPHNNLQPYLVLNFIIALQGIFPPRS
jgi:microcystin-dependent protein